MTDKEKPAAGTLTGSQTLARGLVALRMIGESVDGMTPAGLAEALSIHMSATYRLLRPLVEYGFLRRDPDGRYRVGALCIHLGAQTRLGIRSAALPIMSELVQKANVTAMLLTAEASEAVVLAAVEPSVVPYRVHFMEGQRHPMDRGSAAYAICATRPAQPGDPEQVRLARERGYATSAGEVQHGAYGVAIGLDRARTGLELCLNIGSQSEPLVHSAIPLLRDAVARLHDVLGPEDAIGDLSAVAFGG
ncbi:IclR family transcriptional regulator [Rhodococcus koreensis]